MSNDAYYQSRTPGVYGGTITLITVAAIAVVLRLTARKISAATFWWDDWTLVVALVSRRCHVPNGSNLPDVVVDLGFLLKHGLLGSG